MARHVLAWRHNVAGYFDTLDTWRKVRDVFGVTLGISLFCYGSDPSTHINGESPLDDEEVAAVAIDFLQRTPRITSESLQGCGRRRVGWEGARYLFCSDNKSM